MKGESTFFEHGVTVKITSVGLDSGYDIASITVDGVEISSFRKGEFETEEEALEAAKRLAKNQAPRKTARR